MRANSKSPGHDPTEARLGNSHAGSKMSLRETTRPNELPEDVLIASFHNSIFTAREKSRILAG